MALILNKEDGSGMADANSYADVPDGDMYHEAHLYASAWTSATEARKEAALMMATRLIDSQFQFRGFRAHGEQALQWPRTECPDPDRGGVVWGVRTPECVEPDVVPAAVVAATCELARELLVADRTGAPVGQGLSYSNVGTTQTGYKAEDRRPILPELVQSMLGKFGVLVSGRSGSVRLVRV